MLPLRIGAAVLFGLVLAVSSNARAAGFADVLESPARISPLASRSLLQAVTRAGDRLVAVGQRGHVVVSDDGGATWKQSPVPVSSDLTSVFFVDAKRGWVTGHDGVILHTADAGATWSLQIDGRKANALLVAAMERKSAAEPNSDATKKLLAEAKRFEAQGPDKPFLDVWFADAKQGYAVGAFNLIFRTDDGGASWEPWFDRVDNPKFFNLYSIRPAAGELYIAGESGLVLKLDASARRFKALTAPYNGSFFGVADTGNAVLAFGLRGNVFRSADAGATWDKVDVGLPASIVAAARTQEGATLLADAGGRVARSTDGGRTFARLDVTPAMPLAGIADAGNGKLALAGPRGVAVAAARAH
jgi:photosystem II stability/assembly factor-like uncharacterized protein